MNGVLIRSWSVPVPLLSCFSYSSLSILVSSLGVILRPLGVVKSVHMGDLVQSIDTGFINPGIYALVFNL